MATSNTARRLRWAVPAAAAAAVAAAAVVPSIASGSAPSLPRRSAAQLLAQVQSAKVDGLHGTVVETARLGLPALPGSSSAATTLTPQALLSGSHTARVWFAGPDRQRVALLGPLLETNVVHNGRDVWTYVFATKTATHYRLPADWAAHGSAAPTDPVLTPQRAAEQALKMIDPTTSVSVDRSTKVAKRAAYQLVLVPKDGRSLVTRLVLAMDGKTSMPLRVQVFVQRHTEPAFETGFTDVTFGAPNAAVFAFRTPPGTLVKQGAAMSGQSGAERMQAGRVPGTARPPQGTVIGRGWTAVAKAPFDAAWLGSGSSAGLLNKLAKVVSGGREISLPLMSIFISDAGTVYAGAVEPAALRQVVSTGKPL